MPKSKKPKSAPTADQGEHRSGFWNRLRRGRHIEPAPTQSAPQASRLAEAIENSKETGNVAAAQVPDTKVTQPPSDKQPAESPQSDSPPQPQSSQRTDEEKEFETAAARLESLMRQLRDKEHPKIVVEAIKFKDTADYHGSLNELGTVINGLIDKWAEPDDSNKNSVKRFVEKWYKAAFPYIKDTMTQVKVSCLHFSSLP